jgi:hypothetical protein
VKEESNKVISEDKNKVIDSNISNIKSKDNKYIEILSIDELSSLNKTALKNICKIRDIKVSTKDDDKESLISKIKIGTGYNQSDDNIKEVDRLFY